MEDIKSLEFTNQQRKSIEGLFSKNQQNGESKKILNKMQIMEK